MAKKILAVFLMFVVVVAVHTHKAEAYEEIEEDEKQFNECESACLKECESDNSPNIRCEKKCDNECGEKESEAKLDRIKT